MRACAANDADCATPIATASTDGDGKASLTVPTGSVGFDGYVDIEASGLVPVLVMPNRPVTEEEPLMELGLDLTTQSGHQDDLPGHTIDFTRGIVEMVQWDCQRYAGVGVAFSVSGADSSTWTGYVNAQGEVDDTLTQTTSAAVAISINVPGTSTTVTATRVSTSIQVASHEVPLRPGAVTLVLLSPEP